MDDKKDPAEVEQLLSAPGLADFSVKVMVGMAANWSNADTEDMSAMGGKRTQTAPHFAEQRPLITSQPGPEPEQSPRAKRFSPGSLARQRTVRGQAGKGEFHA